MEHYKCPHLHIFIYMLTYIYIYIWPTQPAGLDRGMNEESCAELRSLITHGKGKEMDPSLALALPFHNVVKPSRNSFTLPHVRLKLCMCMHLLIFLKYVIPPVHKYMQA